FRAVERANFGLTSSAIWLRLAVERAEGDARPWVLELTMTPSLAELYPPEGPRKRAGTSLPFDAREVAEPRVAFVLDPPVGRAVYYVRLTSSDALLLDGDLWIESAYGAKVSTEKLGAGLYYGALAALIVYNAALFLATRDAAYL